MERIHDYSHYLLQCESISEQIQQHLGEKKVYLQKKHINTFHIK